MLPKWLEVGLSELQLGVSEFVGPSSNPRINEYLAEVGIRPGDETPWCAAFVDWCLTQAGLEGTGKPNARSYLGWGKMSEPTLGAIAVLWRSSPESWVGHVAFMLDISDTLVYLLGGNQNDRVSVAAYPKERLLGVRLPTT